VIQQPREPVRARLLAQRVALARGVERERRHRREALDLRHLGVAEALVEADPVDVQHGDDAVLDQQRDRHERLRLHLRALDDRHDRVLVGACDVARAAVGDDPAGHSLGHGERVGHHLVRVGAEREHRHEHLGGAIDLVDRQLVVVEQLRQVMGDPPERVGERVGGEDPGGCVDQRLEGGGVSATGAGWHGHPPGYRPAHPRA
jgi:hypothetical protein